MACRCSFLRSGPAERAALRARDKAGSEGAGRQAVITAGTTARQERPGGGGLPHGDTYGTARRGAAHNRSAPAVCSSASSSSSLLLLCTQAGSATTTTTTTLHAGRASYYYFARRLGQLLLLLLCTQASPARANAQDAEIKVRS